MPGPYTPSASNINRPFNDDEVQYAADELRKIKVALGQLLVVRTVTALTYTLVEADVDNVVNMTNGGIVTIPSGLSVGVIGITGPAATEVIAGTGVTLTTPASLSAILFEDNAIAALLATASNAWRIAGNLRPSAL